MAQAGHGGMANYEANKKGRDWDGSARIGPYTWGYIRHYTQYAIFGRIYILKGIDLLNREGAAPPQTLDDYAALLARRRKEISLLAHHALPGYFRFTPDNTDIAGASSVLI